MRKYLTGTLLLSVLLLLPISGFSIMSDLSDTDEQPLDVQPEIIEQVQPVYPFLCRKEGIEGKVIVRALVNRDGDVDKVVILESSENRALDQSAIDAVHLFTFKPGIINGHPIEAWVQVPILFKLEDSEPKSDEFIKVDNMPEMIKSTQPEYPENAKRLGKEGHVWVKALVSKEGSVSKVQIVNSTCSDCGFKESALKSALQNQFRPDVKDGKPVAVWITYKVEFKLN